MAKEPTRPFKSFLMRHSYWRSPLPIYSGNPEMALVSGDGTRCGANFVLT
jgi:hypothetical protein